MVSIKWGVQEGKCKEKIIIFHTKHVDAYIIHFLRLADNYSRSIMFDWFDAVNLENLNAATRLP